jgi:rhomboid protease GluP
MCPACRTLVERSVGTCPSCGGSMRGVAGGGIGRALTLLVPGSPSLSALLVTANVGMSILVAVLGAHGEGGVMSALFKPPVVTLYLLGAKWTPSIVAGEVWRLVTANYLHGGLIHLGFNSIALVQLGPLIERGFGWRKFFLIYTVTGIAGFALSALFRPDVPSIGASGALYGLLGFAFVFARFRASRGARALADQLGQWMLYGVAMFFIPGIDSVAHVGGAVAGALLALFVDPTEPRTRTGEAWLWALTAAAFAITFGSFAAMAIAYPGHLAELRGQ